MTIFPRSFEEWYKPFTKEEKVWIITAFIIAIILAATTISWHFIVPTRQVPSESKAVEPSTFDEVAKSFEATYKDKVIPAGVEIFLSAQRFSWTPSKIKLMKGVEYKIWISSKDVMHGFSLIGNGVVYNLMVMPGMAYLMHIKFDKEGTYYIICNEYCGIGHGTMRAIIEVVG